jgi:hypothetical protein
MVRDHPLGASKMISERDVSYKNLADFLKNKQWKAANEETLLKLLEASGRIEFLISSNRLAEEDVLLLFLMLDAQGRLKILKAWAKLGLLKQANLDKLFQQLTDEISVPDRLKLLALELLAGLSDLKALTPAEKKHYYEQLRAERSQEKKAVKLFLAMVLFGLIKEKDIEHLQPLLNEFEKIELGKILKLAPNLTPSEAYALLNLSSDELRLLRRVGQTRKQRRRDRPLTFDHYPPVDSQNVEAPQFSELLHLLITLDPSSSTLFNKPLSDKESNFIKLLEMIEELKFSNRIDRRDLNALLKHLLSSNKDTFRVLGLIYGVNPEDSLANAKTLFRKKFGLPHSQPLSDEEATFVKLLQRIEELRFSENISKKDLESLLRQLSFLSNDALQVFKKIYRKNIQGINAKPLSRRIFNFLFNQSKTEKESNFIRLLQIIEELRFADSISKKDLDQLLKHLRSSDEETVQVLADVVGWDSSSRHTQEELTALAKALFRRERRSTLNKPLSDEESTFIKVLEIIEEMSFSGKISRKNLGQLLGDLSSPDEAIVQKNLIGVFWYDASFQRDEDKISNLAKALSRQKFGLPAAMKVLLDRDMLKVKAEELETLADSLAANDAALARVLEVLMNVLLFLPDRLEQSKTSSQAFENPGSKSQNSCSVNELAKRLTPKLTEILLETLTNDRVQLVNTVTGLLKTASHYKLYAANRPILRRILSSPVSKKQREHQLQQLIIDWQHRGLHLTVRDLKYLPCVDLRSIDELWTKNSGNRFGFSAQLKVWHEVQNSQYLRDKQDFLEDFGHQVGWRNSSTWIDYEATIFAIDQSEPSVFWLEESPRGHLPLIPLVGWWCWVGGMEEIVKRLSRCGTSPCGVENNLLTIDAIAEPASPSAHSAQSVSISLSIHLNK